MSFPVLLSHIEDETRANTQFLYKRPGFWITVRNTRICIALIYAYSGIWALLPFLGWGGYNVEPYGTSCTLEWTRFNNGKWILKCRE